MKSKALLAGLLAMALTSCGKASERVAASRPVRTSDLANEVRAAADEASAAASAAANASMNGSLTSDAVRTQCAAATTWTPPPGDRPGPSARRTLAGCDAEAFYYGIGQRADPERARQCAFLQAEHGRDDGFSGESLLMAIYANGRGAARNLDAARHFACSQNYSPAEREGRLAHFAAMQAGTGPARHFDYCDDITSGAAEGQCAAHGERIAAAGRARALAALTAHYNPAQRLAWRRLLHARDFYLDAEANGETMRGGTAEPAFWIQGRGQSSDVFVDVMQRLHQGRLPTASFAVADRTLNEAYAARRRVMVAENGPGEPDSSMLTPTDLRSAQRAWLRYRDAFLAFSEIAYPATPRDQLAAYLTAKRTTHLS
jgi:hypothetical protein